MAFKMDCPHCAKVLNAAETAFGKTVSCPGCKKPIKVPHPGQPSHQETHVVAPPRSGTAQDGNPMPASVEPLPPGVLPMPSDDGAFDFLNGSDESLASPRGLARKAVQGLNLVDMFSGNEEEHVFSLLPGDERLDELAIHYHHLFVVKSGTTRVTPTTHRLLYTATRVCSPVYWLLLVLFPPLIFYYAARRSRNRNISLPLGSFDSVEKRYRPHWLWFVLAIFVGYIVAALGSGAVASVFEQPHQHAVLGESSSLEVIVNWILLDLLGPAVLVLLLATRLVGIDVITRARNGFSIRFSPGDVGITEGQCDAFLQSVHAQMEHIRIIQQQPNSATT